MLAHGIAPERVGVNIPALKCIGGAGLPEPSGSGGSGLKKQEDVSISCVTSLEGPG